MFKTDWGGEYRSLLPFLTSLGIQFRLPCPHVHQQNGKVERKHQHIVEIGLIFLAQAKMPFKFWWDAYVFAVFLINRLPTSTLGHKSLYKCLFSKSPNYNFLRTFGCSCYPYLRPYNFHKLQFRTSQCLFLGYSSAHKGYRCLHPFGRVYVVKIAQFNESEFPYELLFIKFNKNIGSSEHTSIFVPVLIDNSMLEFPAHGSNLANNTTKCFQASSPSQHTTALSPNQFSIPDQPSPFNNSPIISNPLTTSCTSKHQMITRSKQGISTLNSFPICYYYVRNLWNLLLFMKPCLIMSGNKLWMLSFRF